MLNFFAKNTDQNKTQEQWDEETSHPVYLPADMKPTPGGDANRQPLPHYPVKAAPPGGDEYGNGPGAIAGSGYSAAPLPPTYGEFHHGKNIEHAVEGIFKGHHKSEPKD